MMTMGIEHQNVSRRRLLELGALGALSVVGLAACGSDDGSSAANTSTTNPTTSTTATSTTAGSATAASTDCSVIPEETAGPYPGDGSNGPDVLSESGVVRSDITSSFGSSTTTVAGVPTKVRFELVDASAGCTPLKDAAVYVWHCDGQGRYSMYSSGATNENFLRGVQASGTAGVVSFDSIFPGCYSGRWPHIHFEVYPSTSSATNASGRLATSQIALPKDVCESVYSNFSGQYPGSTSNLSGLSITSDNVFGDDGAVHEMATVTGDANQGYTVTLRVPILVNA
jgi:protocatechuate 3,4-dioxygenase beta subunit